jgi:hypothetical protein
LPRPAGAKKAEVDPDVARLLGNLESLLDEEEQRPESVVRSLSTGFRIAIATALAALAVTVVFAFVRRADFAAIPHWQLLVVGTSYAVVAGLLVWRVLLPLHEAETRSEHATALITAAFALPFVWAVVPPHAFGRVLQAEEIRRDCLVLGIGIGGAFIALLRVLDRAADTDPRGVAMVAAAAGLVANFALTLHCPQTGLAHLAIGHAPIGLLLFWIYRRAAGFKAARST